MKLLLVFALTVLAAAWLSAQTYRPAWRDHFRIHGTMRDISGVERIVIIPLHPVALLVDAESAGEAGAPTFLDCAVTWRRTQVTVRRQAGEGLRMLNEIVLRCRDEGDFVVRGIAQQP